VRILRVVALARLAGATSRRRYVKGVPDVTLPGNVVRVVRGRATLPSRGTEGKVGGVLWQRYRGPSLAVTSWDHGPSS